MTGLKFPTRMTFLATLAVVLLALALRIHHLDFESLFMDELHQVSYYGGTLKEIVSFAANQQQPPLDYWIGHFIVKIANNDFWVRFPAAIFGTGAVFLLMLLASRMTMWPVAVSIGFIMAVMPFPVYFSQEARPYAIAGFFMLSTLWSFDRFLTCSRYHFLRLAVFFISVLALLLSRTLAPLMFVTSLFALSFSFYVYLKMSASIAGALMLKRLPLALSAILLALGVYAPFFLNILEKGSHYIKDHSTQGLGFITAGIDNFDPIPLWRAYITQTEPLGWLLLPFVLAVPLILRKNKNRIRNPLPFLVLCMLILTPLLHLFVFQGTAKWHFRPPYPIYLLPLCLLAAGIAVGRLVEWLQTAFQKRRSLIVAVACILVAGLLTDTLADFKTWPKRSDWRGLAFQLANTYGKDALLFFDGLHPPSAWEPTFYGFPRYYRGRSRLMPVDLIPQHLSRLENRRFRPVLIWFFYRDYLLTSKSPYPIMPEFHETVDRTPVIRDRLLKAKSFTGFLVLELDRPSGNGMADLSFLLDAVIKDTGPTDQILDLYLAAAAINKSQARPVWREYLETARALMPEKLKSSVTVRLKLIEGMP